MSQLPSNSLPADIPATELSADASAMADDLAALGKRARPVLRTALREESQPVAVGAKALINSRNGLLASGVRARSGSGDRPDRVSALVQSVTTRAKFANYRGRRVRKVAAGAGSDRYNVYYGMAYADSLAGPWTVFAGVGDITGGDSTVNGVGRGDVAEGDDPLGPDGRISDERPCYDALLVQRTACDEAGTLIFTGDGKRAGDFEHRPFAEPIIRSPEELKAKMLSIAAAHNRRQAGR